ncbi:anti-sigma-D factor RsdA [Mycolicibacterium sp. HK-90]|uniref:anti-sigma-D factor RsdA n=1 Tax=Mycolicibacterium sp. HK-90 TaxID=3056937 RepID=UPI00265B225E|nr:anti-sigma-D factor RsdA [Mycolicibacterium sp. HK-90]WKG04954.1 anti-sigma-D factor RsdA [Mycolicibacterium sp. HK-90]
MPDFGRWTSNGGDPSLNEINRSEKFIEALSLEHQVYATDREEAELAVLLAAWRDEARRAPMSGIATPREAVTALDKATAKGRVRFPMALVGSMAAAMLCLGGFGAAVYGAGPGDALYGVRGIVFGTQPVKRDVGVELASNELKQVQQLIDDGQWEQAQQKLQTLTTTVATVGDEQRKQELVDQWQQLSVKVENRDPNATVPPDAPPVVLPEVTVTTTPSSPSEVPPGTLTSVPTTTPSDSTPGSETSAPPSTTSPSDTPTSAPTTTQPSTTVSPSPSDSAEPTTTSAPPSTSAAQTSPTHTSSAPTTSAAPAVELPPAVTTTVAPVEPTSVPSAPPARTTVAPPADEAEEGQESPAGGREEAPALPAIELPLLPGLGGSAQR